MSRVHRYFLASISALLVGSSFSARADIAYPTETDLRGFQTLCAGGSVKEAKGRVDAALQTWKWKPGAELTLDGVIRDLGAVMEKVKDGSDSVLYEKYVDCVQHLIVSYLQHANAAPAPKVAPSAPSKTRS